MNKPLTLLPEILIPPPPRDPSYNSPANLPCDLTCDPLSPGPQHHADLPDRCFDPAFDPSEGRGDRVAGRLLPPADRPEGGPGGTLHLPARVARQKTGVDYRLQAGTAGS